MDNRDKVKRSVAQRVQVLERRLALLQAVVLLQGLTVVLLAVRLLS